MEQLAARRAHNPEVVGSNPTGAMRDPVEAPKVVVVESADTRARGARAPSGRVGCSNPGVAMLPGYGIGIRALSLKQVIAGSTPALAICPGRPAAEDAAFSARRSWVRIPLGV